MSPHRTTVWQYDDEGVQRSGWFCDCGDYGKGLRRIEYANDAARLHLAHAPEAPPRADESTCRHGRYYCDECGWDQP